MDCVFCAVNNKVRTYAHGKLMSNCKDLGKSFASGHGFLRLAGRGSLGGTGRQAGRLKGNGQTAKQCRSCVRNKRTCWCA